MISRLGLYQILETGFIFKQIKKKKPIDVESIRQVLEKMEFFDTCLYVPKNTCLILLDEKDIWSFMDYYPKYKGKKAYYDEKKDYPVVIQKYIFDGRDMHLPLHPTQACCHMYQQTLFSCYDLLKKDKTIDKEETSSEKEVSDSSRTSETSRDGEN